MASVTVENRMNAETGTSPQPCKLCGRDVWVEPSSGCYVDSRYVTTHRGSAYLSCSDGQDHEL